jgi:phosphorylase/glycogen(starch) synthase
MINNKYNKPSALFEVSWEICNKVGGIHTVVSTKVLSVQKELGNNYFLIGPDVWRDEKENPEFTPLENEYKSWVDHAAGEGITVKIGQWNIAGKPMVILIDFYGLIAKKDDILKKMWETYKLDSISGQWDYIEPVLFGYAAGKVIESFVNFQFGYQDDILAHFHEWMTGSGVLYLKDNAPHIGTIFTTHATVLGRALAGNNRPVYSKLNEFNPVKLGHEFNVTSKHSLESLSGIHSDAFSTVSDITSKECSALLGKEVDLVTPNGFEDSFVPPVDNFDEKRKEARTNLLKVAGTLLGEELPEDSLLIANSGRYEYKNKGIDLFIDAMAELDLSEENKRTVVAFALIPANNSGPDFKLKKALENGSFLENPGNPYLTHGMHDPQYDPILNSLKNSRLKNNKSNKVKFIFVPVYLNGDDGIFNLSYYDLLIGFDLTIFPSYYEPWGYTPLESLAFRIPTMTTTLAGFGMWVKDHVADPGFGISVIQRDDHNDAHVVKDIVSFSMDFCNLSGEALKEAREKAFEVSRIALWSNLVEYYYEAYNIALQKVQGRILEGKIPRFPEKDTAEIVLTTPHFPQWKTLIVESGIPEGLSFLSTLSRNLWWSWNTEATALWKEIEPSLWKKTKQNPIKLLKKVNYKRLLHLKKDENFVKRMKQVENAFHNYMSAKPEKDKPLVAYFSMEYGLHDSLKIFSGGLGVLAGDYLKEASDSNAGIVGIGLLYRYGYFKQVLSLKGDQQANYEAEQFSDIPVEPVKDEDGNWKTVIIILHGRTLKIRLWKANIGRVALYLLDTDFEENQENDRSITHHLYGGDLENRLKQEIVLGIGGIRAIESLGISPDVYHSNEGHSAFIGVERLSRLIREMNLNYQEALEIVRSSTLFTTHTPVPAGHDAFPEDLFRTYMAHYPERLKISWDEFYKLGGDGNPGKAEKFNMSFLAAHMSQEINGVSMLHGTVSRELFKNLWPGYLPEELNIGYVTNGVHLPTWAASEMTSFINGELKNDWHENQCEKEVWKKIDEIESQELWKVKYHLKEKLISRVKDRLQKNLLKRYESPRNILEVSEALNPGVLTIGFARRFATYKRAHLLFKDLDRLDELVNNKERPVQFIFAGKAHPHDGGGQGLIRRIVEVSKMPRFRGKILFLQNYDMELAKLLVQGVDVWMNTPTRPLEASGTSGEKGVMNGTLHFSVLDGWWVEGFKKNAGWALTGKRTYKNQEFQDELDTEIIFNTLESEIIPLYYNKNKAGIPEKWIKFMKNSFVEVAPDFTMRRMLRDYQERFYSKLFERNKDLKSNKYEKAVLLAAWKNGMARMWKNLEVISVDLSGLNGKVYKLGGKYEASVILGLRGVPPSSIGLELVVTDKDKEGNLKLIHSQEFKMEKFEGGKAYFKMQIVPLNPGVFNYGFRIFPKHKDLPHRQDFNLVSWV